MKRARALPFLRNQGLLISLLYLLLGAVAAPRSIEAQAFLRGDANTDGVVSISDILTIRRYLFIGGIDLPCVDAADADDGQPVDGCNCSPQAGSRLNFSDGIILIRYLFIQEAWKSILPEPFPIPGLDPTSDDAECASYEVKPPVETSDVIRVGEVDANPGEVAEIPVFLSSSVNVEAIQLVIEYDPAVFTPFDGRDGISYDGTFYARFGDSRADLSLVKAHPDAGLLVAAIVGSLTQNGFEVPPGEDTLIVKIRGTVSATAPPGTYGLVPTNGSDGGGVGPYKMKNEVTFQGGARFATTLPKRVPGLLRIVGPDGMDFMRGDSNSDGRFDLSDAIFTLNSLFLDGRQPLCPDAADTNDDGKLDLSDPVAGLNYLFAPSSLKEPLLGNPGTCGADQSPDDLGPCSYGSCP